MLQNDDKGTVNFQFLRIKIELVLIKLNEIRGFIPPVKTIEDRLDSISKFDVKTIDQIMESIEIAMLTIVENVENIDNLD